MDRITITAAMRTWLTGPPTAVAGIRHPLVVVGGTTTTTGNIDRET